MQLTGQYLPGISRQAYSDYLQSQSAIANFMADPKEVAAFLNRNGLYEDAFIDDYINQLDPSNRLDHLRQGLKEGLAELERQVQEHLVEQAMGAAVGPALGAASFVARKGVAKIAFQRLRKKSARAAGMRVTGRLAGTAAPVKGLTGIIEKHHQLPREFAAQFRRAGIDNLDDYIVELDKALHRINPGGLHTNSGGNWNRVWREFFARNKTPTRQQILDQLAKMRKDFGLE
jgi:hypothetical protein